MRWDDFKSSFNRMVDRNNGQTELNFDKIETDYIDEAKIETKKLSSFNKNLQQGLNFNPKENE